MLAIRYKHLLNRCLEPFARLIVRSGLPPTAITVAAPVLGLLACLWFVRTRAVLPFSLAIAAIGCLDGLDGAVARMSGRVTKFGAYLDAVCDRYVESMVVLAVAVVSGYWALSLVVLVGGLLVSYTKARAAMEVTVANDEWPDLMERMERGVLFLSGLALSAVVPWRPWGHDLFWWTLLLLAFLIHFTVVQRIFRARRLILARGGR